MRSIVSILIAAAALAQPGPPGPRRIGVGLGQSPGGAWVITRVTPLSPADRAGLRPGDLIVRVRGVEVNTDDPETFTEAFEPNPVHLSIERHTDGAVQRFYVIVPKRPPRR